MRALSKVNTRSLAAELEPPAQLLHSLVFFECFRDAKANKEYTSAQEAAPYPRR
jgi:hypothetical protein